MILLRERPVYNEMDAPKIQYLKFLLANYITNVFVLRFASVS